MKAFETTDPSASVRLGGNARATSKRVSLLIHLVTGTSVALAALFADPILGLEPSFGPMQRILLSAGLVLILAGFLPTEHIISRVSSNLCLLLISVCILAVFGELYFRTIKFDFDSQAKAFRALPPFFRQPIEPVGEVYFKRPGPDRWTGQVLNTYVKGLDLVPNPYVNEPVITVEYDHQGFRNPENLKSWDIAITGDSFTELGYLPYEELFTTVLAHELKLQVLNLGVSYTGPLTQLTYLKKYGLTERTKHSVIMFFEGNDIGDLAGEYHSLMLQQQAGKRDYREFKPQSSLVRFLFVRVMRKIWPVKHERNVITGYFKSAAGDLPVTLAYSPPGRSDLSAETMHQLRYFFSEYAAFGKDSGVAIWLAYVPTKERVLHDHLEFSQSTLAKIPKLNRLAKWRPTDLPQLIGELCSQYGVKFIDLTPALIKETERSGQLLYNGLNETHLNRKGSFVVGQELARQFERKNPGTPDPILQNWPQGPLKYEVGSQPERRVSTDRN